MEAVRHLALGCCVLSTVAGVIRIFWPDNGFGPVINAVLALYIVSAGFQMVQGTDWQLLSYQLYRLPAAAEQNQQNYLDYSRQLGISASVEAVEQVLSQAGIEAAVRWDGSCCSVELVREADRVRAQSVLEASCGELPYEIATGGSAP